MDKHLTPEPMIERLRAVVGKRCWDINAGPGLGASFSLSLGEKSLREPPLARSRRPPDEQFISEYKILVWCTWRLDGPSAPVTSSDQEENNIATGLSVVVNQYVAGISATAPAWDLVIDFDRGYRLSVFCDHLPENSTIEQNWELWHHNVGLLTGPGYAWEIYYGRSGAM